MASSGPGAEGRLISFRPQGDLCLMTSWMGFGMAASGNQGSKGLLPSGGPQVDPAHLEALLPHPDHGWDLGLGYHSSSRRVMPVDTHVALRPRIQGLQFTAW